MNSNHITLSVTVIVIYLLCIIQGSLSIGVIEFGAIRICKDGRLSCQNRTLRCTTKDCRVICEGNSSCNNVVIDRKQTTSNDPGQMHVFCNTPNSCSNAVINDATQVKASQNSLKNATIYCSKHANHFCRIYCDNYQSCQNTHVFCPHVLPRNTNIKYCQVYGNGRNNNNNNLNIHTLYGVPEILLISYNDPATLYCNLDLAECDIKFTNARVSCKNESSQCQNPELNDGIILMHNSAQLCTGIECQNKALICTYGTCAVRCNNSRIARRSYDTYDGSIIVECNAPHSCSNSIIYDAIRVKGFHQHSLSNAQIYCQKEKRCEIECNSKLACNDATFDGKMASELYIQCNSEQDTCNNIHVYCPYEYANRPSLPLCGIRGASNDKHNTLNLHFNGYWGWNGIRIGDQYKHNTQVIGNENMMHIYADRYREMLCRMSSVVGVCVTDSPTLYPTQMPTDTTIIPTISPTQAPTLATSTPTAIPTQIPTKAPTQMPTIPTNNPTRRPTESPTNDVMGNGLTITIIMGCIIAIMIV